jgi:predicted dienelactone hydrolase
MRLFEVLLLLTPIPFLIWPVISKQKRPAYILALPLVSLLFLLLHLLIEGHRWQMIPAYGLTAVLGLYALRQWQRLDNQQSRSKSLLVVVLSALGGLLLVGITAVLPLALPVPRLAAPDGPYEIGTVTYYWVDDSRQEMFGPEPGGPRELMVQIWYPAEAVDGAEPIPWHDDIKTAGPALANTLDLPPFLLDHISLSRTHSVAGAPLAAGQPQYQLLIFSHGLGGVRMQNTFQVEELASRGYVVAAIDHTYGGAVTIFPDGRVALFDLATIEGDDTAEAGNRLIHGWAEDGRFVLDQLEQLNEQDPDGRFTNHLRLDQIGYFGHSTGGGTAFLFCQIDDRCGAGAALDGWLEPLVEEIAAQPIEKPFLFLKAEDWSTVENSAAIQAADQSGQTPGSVITLPGTAHYNFSDLPLLTPLTPQMGLTGPANGRETLAAINDYTLSFFNNNLVSVQK